MAEAGNQRPCGAGFADRHRMNPECRPTRSWREEPQSLGHVFEAAGARAAAPEYAHQNARQGSDLDQCVNQTQERV